MAIVSCESFGTFPSNHSSFSIVVLIPVKTTPSCDIRFLDLSPEIPYIFCVPPNGHCSDDFFLIDKLLLCLQRTLYQQERHEEEGVVKFPIIDHAILI